MIDLRDDRLQAPDAPPPPFAVDPSTGQEYLLIRQEIYDLLRGTLKPYKGGWDAPLTTTSSGKTYEARRSRRD